MRKITILSIILFTLVSFCYAQSSQSSESAGHGVFMRGTKRVGWGRLTRSKRKEQKAIVEQLIARGEDINSKNEDGLTPLFWAVRKGYDDLVSLLISKGADVNTKDNVGSTPLYWAQENGLTAIADMLIAKGAKAEAGEAVATTSVDSPSAANAAE